MWEVSYDNGDQPEEIEIPWFSTSKLLEVMLEIWARWLRSMDIHRICLVCLLRVEMGAITSHYAVT